MEYWVIGVQKLNSCGILMKAVINLNAIYNSESKRINSKLISNLCIKPKKKRRSFSSLMMIYDDNAPLPPPDA